MPYTSADIRNVCLLGPSNAGKTQLAEALLHAGGAIPACGSVDKGETVSDFTKAAKAKGAGKVRIVQSNKHTMWYILPPISFIIHPVISNVAGDAK